MIKYSRKKTIIFYGTISGRQRQTPTHQDTTERSWRRPEPTPAPRYEPTVAQPAHVVNQLTVSQIG